MQAWFIQFSLPRLPNGFLTSVGLDWNVPSTSIFTEAHGLRIGWQPLEHIMQGQNGLLSWPSSQNSCQSSNPLRSTPQQLSYLL